MRAGYRFNVERTIWISWQKHRRTESICARLEIPLKIFLSQREGLARYLLLSLKTLSFLIRTRPHVLIVQNPSLILSAVSLLARPVFGYRLVVDAHNEGVKPYINTRRFFLKVTNWLLRRADITLVTNPYLAKFVTQAGGYPVVLPDPIPAVPSLTKSEKETSAFRIVAIATFADDEPLKEIFEAILKLDCNIELKVTGNVAKCPEELKQFSGKRIQFTGFLADYEYWRCIAEADLVVDLTKMEYCLVCGSYEAMAVHTPILLTDDPAAKYIFKTGVVFTENDSNSIVDAINIAISNHQGLKEGIVIQCEEFELEWIKMAKTFFKMVKGSP